MNSRRKVAQRAVATRRDRDVFDEMKEWVDGLPQEPQRRHPTPSLRERLFCALVGHDDTHRNYDGSVLHDWGVLSDLVASHVLYGGYTFEIRHCVGRVYLDDGGRRFCMETSLDGKTWEFVADVSLEAVLEEEDRRRETRIDLAEFVSDGETWKRTPWSPDPDLARGIRAGLASGDEWSDSWEGCIIYERNGAPRTELRYGNWNFQCGRYRYARAFLTEGAVAIETSMDRESWRRLAAIPREDALDEEERTRTFKGVDRTQDRRENPTPPEPRAGRTWDSLSMSQQSKYIQNGSIEDGDGPIAAHCGRCGRSHPTNGAAWDCCNAEGGIRWHGPSAVAEAPAAAPKRVWYFANEE